MTTIALELERKRGSEPPTDAKSRETTLVEQRTADAESLAEAKGRYGELEPLAEARDAAEAEVQKATERHGRAVTAYRQTSDEIGRQHSRAELSLRRTAPRLIHDSGPAISFLLDLRRHVRQHMRELTIHRDREYVRDFEKAGKPKKEQHLYNDARARVRLADEANELAPTVDAVLEAVRELQLEPNPDLPGALAEVLADLPARCPCGATIDTSAVLDWTPDPAA